MEPVERANAEMELLETSPPPGRLERLVTAALRSRPVRLGGVVVAALVVGVGAVNGLPSNEMTTTVEQAEPEKADAAARSLPLGPPPWVTSEREGWEVIGSPRVRRLGGVHVVTFTAVNHGSQARKPAGLRVVGSFVGLPRSRFAAACTGFDLHESGHLRPLTTGAEAGETISVRCAGTDRTSGPAVLDVESLEIQGAYETE